uniref:Uncharacterized protein n=1 Tax=Arundo donax TaxID=35708 RepID=A0A0A9A843_ARUDO
MQKRKSNSQWYLDLAFCC